MRIEVWYLLELGTAVIILIYLLVLILDTFSGAFINLAFTITLNSHLVSICTKKFSKEVVLK